MNPEELNDRLKAIEDTVDKNHKLLIRIRRVQRNAGLMRLFYWLVIIGIGLGAFYYLQPYVKTVRETYGKFKVNIPQLQNVDLL